MPDPRTVDCTEDKILGGRVTLRQPAGGFRAAIDPVLLAAAVPAEAGDRVLEIGAGTGAAALCLASRVPGCDVTGLELQQDLAKLANENAALNGCGDRVRVIAGDLLAPPSGIPEAPFDHAMANPPHLAADSGNIPPDAARAAAMVEGGARLTDWIAFGLGRLRKGGTLTLIHRADRLDEILAALDGRAGGIVVFPLWPAAGKDARRIIIQARQDISAPLRVTAGLVLHRPEGGYTAAADAILRDGGAIAP